MKFEKLKNIIEIQKGKKPSFVDTPDKNSVRVLQIDDLRNDSNPKFTNDKAGVFAQKDDVLIAWDGANAGTIGYGKSGYIGSTIALLRKKNPDLYSTTFIGIFLQSQYQYLRSKATGATIPHISRKALESLEVPVISIDDQLHIANLLSKTENLISQRKESIKLLDEFLKSTFLEMFGDPVRNEKEWNTKQLGLVTLMKAGQFVAASDINSEFTEGMYSCYGGNGLRGYVKTYTHDGEFVLIGRQGALCGNVKVANGQFHATEHAVVCSPKIQYETYWLYYLLDIINLNKYASGAAQPGLAVGRLEQIEIIFAPLSLQTRFAQIVKKTEALKTLYQQSLQELENLYGSLSQRAFKGELNFNKEKSENIIIKKERPVKVYPLPSEKLSVAAEPITQKRSEKSEAYVRKMVLAAEIANQLYSEPTFGHVKFMKLLYLCEEVGNMKLMTNYKKFAAGPFDNKLINSVDTYFKQSKWFKVNEVKTVQGKRYTYSPDINVEKYKHLYDGYFSEYQPTILQLINLLRKKDTKHCEIVATLYYVWKELKSNKSLVNDQVLLKGFYNFHKEKEKFPPALVLEKKKWIEQESILPN